jgi:hypothetical protein
VCTDDFSLLCLRSTKTDKDAPKTLSIGHKPYGPKTIKPEIKNGLPADNGQYPFDVHEYVLEKHIRACFKKKKIIIIQYS